MTEARRLEDDDISITQIGRGGNALLRFSNGSVYDVPRLASDYLTSNSAETDRLEAAYQLALDQNKPDTNELQQIGAEIFRKLEKAAPDEWERLRQNRYRLRRIIVQGDIRFHRVPWELMGYAGRGNLQRAAVVRQMKGKRVRFQSPQLGQELRILVVTARPYGLADVGHRDVVGPLLDHSHWGNHRPPRIDVLRGGNWEALEQRLERASKEHDQYHIVHFDMHGEVGIAGDANDKPAATVHFEQLEGRDDNSADGRPPAVVADRRDVTMVAGLLIQHDVQIAVFNACHSAHGGAERSSENLAFHLIEQGIPAAIGMRRRLTVEGAALFCRELYERLATSSRIPHPLTFAVQGAREELRRAAQRSRLALDESSLPVLFVRDTPIVGVSPPSTRTILDIQATARSEREWMQRVSRVAPYSVFGRDLDERVLRGLLFEETDKWRGLDRPRGAPDVRLVTVTGLAGIGKTTVLIDLIRNWDRFNYVDHAVLLDGEEVVERFVELGDTSDAISANERADLAVVSWLDAAFERVGLPDGFVGGGRGDDPGQSIGFKMSLADETLLVVDQMEAVTSFDGVGAEELRACIERWFGEAVSCRNWILLASHTDVSWLGDGMARKASFHMGPLDPVGAIDLARRILNGNPVDEDDLIDLVRIGRHHPRSIVELAEAARESSVEKVIEGYLSGTPGLFEAEKESLDSGGLLAECRPFAPFTQVLWPVQDRLLVGYLDRLAVGETGSGSQLLGFLEQLGFVERRSCRRVTDGPDLTVGCYSIHPALPYLGRELANQEERPPWPVDEAFFELGHLARIRLVLFPWRAKLPALVTDP